MLRHSLLRFVFLLSTAVYGQSDFHRLLDKGGQALMNGNIPDAKQFLEGALDVMPRNVDPEDQSVFYNNLGVLYYQTGEYKKGIEWYQRELAIYKQEGNDSLVAGSLHNLGLAYKKIGLYKKAMEEIVSSARMFEKLGNQKELSAAWNAMGNIQFDIGDYSRALAYHRKALAIRESINYTKGIADSYHNIGETHLAMKHYVKAEVYLKEALRLKKTLDNQSNVVNTLTILGKLYIASGDPKRAYQFLLQAYKEAQVAGISARVAESICYLGAYYGTIGELQKARQLFHRSQEFARSSREWPLLIEALQGELTVAEQHMPVAEVIRKYHELLETRDKVQADLNRKEIARLEIQYDVQRKNDELKLRRKQASIDRLSKQRLTGWLAAVGSMAVFAGIAFYQTRRRKKQVEQQKDEIVHLHFELSHRTKNYFSLLSGILRTDRKKAKSEDVVRILDVNINRLDAMSLVQGHLLQNSRQSNSQVQLDSYLDHLIDALLLNLFPSGNTLNVKRIMDEVFIDYDKAMRVAIILNELICNAIEHGLVNVREPELSISLKRIDGKLLLTVRDNGPGRPEEFMQPGSVKGRDLIAKLLHTIRGSISYRNDHGCIAEVSITA